MKAMSMHPAGEAYTLQDYLQWEGDWELIHGQPAAMAPSPSFDHQRVSAAAFQQLARLRVDQLVLFFDADIEGRIVHGCFLHEWLNTFTVANGVFRSDNRIVDG